MADPHTNFGYSTIATAPSPASSGTSLVVQAGDGAKFPSSGAFNATVWPASTQPTAANSEIVRVTAISTDTFTITRAQESSSARTIVVGDQIADTVTVKTLTDVELNVYVTDQNKTIPATTQVIFDDYLEVAASFFYELSTDATLVIGDFATPLPRPDQNTNIFVTVADELVPSNSEIVFSDFYELSAPFGTEVATNGLLQLGTVPNLTASGIIAAVQYAPASLVSYSFTSTTLTAIDSANLAVSFTVPASGNVLVTFVADMQGNSAVGIGLGLLNHSSGAQIGATANSSLSVATTTSIMVSWLLSGLSPGSTLGIDIAAGTTSGGTAVKVFAQGATGAVSGSNASPAVITVYAAP